MSTRKRGHYPVDPRTVDTITAKQLQMTPEQVRRRWPWVREYVVGGVACYRTADLEISKEGDEIED